MRIPHWKKIVWINESIVHLHITLNKFAKLCLQHNWIFFFPKNTWTGMLLRLDEKTRGFLNRSLRSDFHKKKFKIFCLSFFLLQLFSTRFFLFFNSGHFKIPFPVVFGKAICYFVSFPVMKLFSFEIWYICSQIFQLWDASQSREPIGWSTSSAGDCLLICNHFLVLFECLVQVFSFY